MTDSIRVGAAAASITPPLGSAMGGYGARTGVASGVASPLLARTFVFDDGSCPVALAICDLLFATRDITDAARRRIGDRLGWPAGQIMVTSTHTHSGPAALTRSQDAEYVDQIASQIATAVVTAFESRRPAVLKYVETPVTSISQNRRDPDGPLDPIARILVAESPDGAERIATVINYACHATVLEHDNLQISPDFPGATCGLAEQAVGGLAAYLQGCAGSTNPVWMNHGHGEARRVGAVLGSAAAHAVLETTPVGHGQWGVNLSWSTATPKDIAGGQLVAAGPIAARSTTVTLEPRVRPSASEIDDGLDRLEDALAKEADQSGSSARALLAERATLRAERYRAQHPYVYRETADQATPRPGEAEVEVQALILGPDLAIVGIPGEPFLGIGEAIRQHSGFVHLLVAGYANEAIGYVPMAADFPLAGYEVGMAEFTAGTAELLIQGGLRVLEDGKGTTVHAGSR